MEPLSMVGGIIKVVKAIVKAANEARQCKTRCLELAARANVIGEIVGESKAPNEATTTTTRVLDRLHDALEEALEVVHSCSSRSFPKLLLAGSRTSSRIDNAERKINNCLLELGVANDVRLLSLGNQQTTTTATAAAGRRLAVHDDGVVPRTTNTTTINTGIVNNINAKHSFVRAKKTSSMRTSISAGGSVNIHYGDSSSRNGTKEDISAGGSVNIHYGDSSSRNGTKEDSMAATRNNSRRVSASAGRSSGHGILVGHDDFNWNTRKQHVTATAMRGRRRDDKNGQATAGEHNREAAAAAGPQMPSTTWPAAALPQGPQDCQYPYGGAGDNGGVPYHYYPYSSAEEDPNSCSIM